MSRDVPAGVGRLGVLRTLGAAIACAVVMLLLALHTHHLQLEFEISSATGAEGELFHAGAGEEYAPDRSQRFALQADGRLHQHAIRLATPEIVHRVRLDIGSKPGPILVKSATAKAIVLGLALERRELAMSAAPLHDAVRLPSAPGELSLLATGADPYVDIALPEDFVSRTTRMRWLLAGMLALLAGIVVFAGVRLTDRWLVGDTARSIRSRLRIPSAVHRLAARVDDERVVRLGGRGMALLLIVLSLGALGVATKTNFSSVGMWDSYLPSPTASGAVLVGTPRAIRSDEWLVHTPWMLAQASSGLPLGNGNIGGEHAPLLTSVPVAHPFMAFQPEFWGFVAFDGERALAWLWMYKVLGLFASVFMLLMLLTRSDFAVSLLGAVWLLASSYTQWWFSSNLAEILIGFCLAMVGLAYVCLSARRSGLIAGFVALLLGTATFVLQVYPAYQVPLGYLALTLIAAFCLDPARRNAFKQRMMLRIALLLVAGASLLTVFIAVWSDARSTVDAITATVYPGKRTSVGGEMTWSRLFDGLFEPWRIGEKIHPYTALNASESSNFLLLFPLVVVGLLVSRGRATKDPVLPALAIFCCAFAAWMVVTLPMTMATTLSNATLLSFVAAPRALPAMGLASILLCSTWIAAQRTRRNGHGRLPPWACALAVFAVYHYGALIVAEDPAYFTGWRIMLGCVAAALGALAIWRGRLGAFAALVVLLAIPAVTVNPLVHGLGPLTGKPSMAAAREASLEEPTLWIAVGSGATPQALKANGMEVFGGATYVPDPDRMSVLDPQGDWSSIWNRYAHIVVDSQPGLAAPTFELLHPDLYRVRVDVCSRVVDTLGVNRVAYHNPAPDEDRRCLSPIGDAPLDGLWLYRRFPLDPKA
jgi:hypothetical protein